MAPRGLSAEEKRVKLVEIFHESKDFYQLKELEKIAPKLKGIGCVVSLPLLRDQVGLKAFYTPVSQSVKEVLQSLVDDGLVQTDKIGSSNFFWSFPSQRGAAMQSRLGRIKESREAYLSQILDVRAAIEMERSVRLETDERKIAVEKLTEAKKQLAALEKELQAYGICDPNKMEEKIRAVTLAKEATLRWTDNYSILLSHFTRQNGVEPEQIQRYLGVGDDYEDVS